MAATSLPAARVLIQRAMNADKLPILPGYCLGVAAEKIEDGTNSQADYGFGIVVCQVSDGVNESDDEAYVAREALILALHCHTAEIATGLTAWKIEIEPGNLNEPWIEGVDDKLINAFVIRVWIRA